MDRGRLIALEGRSATGKTTLVRIATGELGWTPLAEAFDRLDPAPSLAFDSPRELLDIEATLLAEEGRRYREARRECDRGRTVLADTGFLGPLTYTRGLVALGRAPVAVWRTVERRARSMLRRETLGIPDLTVYLSTTPEERAQRARSDAGRHPAALMPRHEAVGEVEQSYFETLFPATLPGRFRTLRDASDATQLVASLRSLVEDALLAPPSPAEGLALLSLLDRSLADELRPSGGPNR